MPINSRSRRRARHHPLPALLLAACLLPAGAGARPKPPPPPPEYVPPPPPPPAGPVGLPDRLLADAAAYKSYLEHVTATSPGFSDAASVAHALRAGAAYEPHALVRGAIAYAAIAALEDQEFVGEIRAAGTTPDYRHQMTGYILSNPAYVFVLSKHSDGAAGLARQALGDAGLKLYQAGKTIRVASFTIQHQNWSKQDVADRPGRLAAVESSAESPMPAADEEVQPLQRAASGTAPLTIAAPPLEPPYTPLVARALQLAAVAAIGEATNDAYDALTSITQEDDTISCLHLAKLNLHQCLAVAKPNYEDVFCLGQHAMVDTGSCLVKNAGLTLPPEPPPPPAAPAKTASTTPKRRVHHARS